MQGLQLTKIPTAHLHRLHNTYTNWNKLKVKTQVDYTRDLWMKSISLICFDHSSECDILGWIIWPKFYHFAVNFVVDVELESWSAVRSTSLRNELRSSSRWTYFHSFINFFLFLFLSHALSVCHCLTCLFNRCLRLSIVFDFIFALFFSSSLLWNVSKLGNALIEISTKRHTIMNLFRLTKQLCVWAWIWFCTLPNGAITEHIMQIY